MNADFLRIYERERIAKLWAAKLAQGGSIIGCAPRHSFFRRLMRLFTRR